MCLKVVVVVVEVTAVVCYIMCFARDQARAASGNGAIAYKLFFQVNKRRRRKKIGRQNNGYAKDN